MSRWLVWALLSMILWGIWGVAAAKAERTGTTWGVLAGAVLIEALIVVPRVGEIGRSLSWALVVTGLCGVLAYWAMFRALGEGGPPASVIMLTAMYPVVTSVGVVLVLNEAFTWRQGVALLLVVGAAVLLNG